MMLTLILVICTFLFGCKSVEYNDDYVIGGDSKKSKYVERFVDKDYGIVCYRFRVSEGIHCVKLEE